FEKFWCSGVNTALTLNRFDDNGTDFIGHGCTGAVQVIVLGKADAGHERLEWLLVLFARGGSQRSKKPAMECPCKSEDLILVLVALFTGVATCKLEGALVGIGPSETKVDFIGEAFLTQLFGKSGMVRRMIQIAHM